MTVFTRWYQRHEMIIVVFVAMLFMGRCYAYGDVHAVVEGFSGSGPFDGLDEPGWLTDLDPLEFVFDDGALDISLPREASAARLLRAIDGFGSFTTVVDLQHLYLDPFDPEGQDGASAFSSLWLSHLWKNASGGTGGVFASIGTSPDEDGVFLRLDSPQPGTTIYTKVPQVNGPARIEFHFDTVRREVSAEFTLDNSEPIVVGPLPYTGSLEEVVRHEVSLSLSVEQNGGPLVAHLDSFLVLGKSTVLGDFSGNGILDVDDLLILNAAIRANGDIFDLTGDQLVTTDDVRLWVHDLRNTYFGDANLDGEFSSADLINVFQAGEYEDNIVGNSLWSTGDWNADGEFTTRDLVVAFQDGGYEQGPRTAVSSVPEPSSLTLFMLGLCGIVRRRTVR